MAIVRMKKLSLSVMSSVRDEVWAALQKLGCVHLEGISPEGMGGLADSVKMDSAEMDSLLSDIRSALEFLDSQRAKIKKGLVESLAETRPLFSLAEMEKIVQNTPLKSLLSEVQETEKHYKNLTSRLSQLKKERDETALWASVPVDFDLVLGKTENLVATIGSVPLEEETDINEALQAVTLYAEAVRVYSSDKDAFYYIVMHKNDARKVQDFLFEKSFFAANPTQRSGQIDAVIKAIDSDIVATEKEIDALHKKIQELVLQFQPLSVCFDYYSLKKTKIEALRRGIETSSVSFYKGWIPEKKQKQVEKTLSSFTGIDYTIEAPSGDDEAPVDIKVNAISSPFEVITRMYGLPAYGKSVDPTVHISPFYFIFFGFCLSDFFYGLIMFVAFGYLAYRARKNLSVAPFLRFLSVVGFSTMIFGALFGSYFGDLFTTYLKIGDLPQFIGSITFVDPLKAPLVVMYYALLLGGIQLLYGLIIKIAENLKENVIDALFESVPWLIFLSGFFGLMVLFGVSSLINDPVQKSKLISIDPSVSQYLLYAMMAGAGLIVINGIRKEKNPIAGFFGGLYSLYGASSFMGDILSYARLLALGVGTGVISMVMNFIGFMIIGPNPDLTNPLTWLSIIGGLAVLVGGHAFNLIMSAFGAFIHSARLQYVEFFSKFYVAGSKEYKPLKEEGVYYDIK